MKKIAVVLFNLGGPDSPESVQPFLYNLFNDPAIIGLPTFFRKRLATLISKKRAPIAGEIYEHLGGGSPLLPNTEAQAEALIRQLEKDDTGNTYQAFICMRYWHPMTPEAVEKVKAWQPDEIVLLPLYPQFSTTTTGSSVNAWHQEARQQGLAIRTKAVCCYPQDNEWITAVTQAILTHAQHNNVDFSRTRLLFSAHGLPEKIIKKGDPYQWQVEQTVASVVKQLNINNLDYITCYQSRVGPLKWIGPSTEDEIKRGGLEQKSLMLVPIAFVSEHSETLVELDIEYRELADNAGVPGYTRVSTVGTSAAYINGLAGLVQQTINSDKTLVSPKVRCPESFKNCPCRKVGKVAA